MKPELFKGLSYFNEVFQDLSRNIICGEQIAQRIKIQ